MVVGLKKQFSCKVGKLCPAESKALDWWLEFRLIWELFQLQRSNITRFSMLWGIFVNFLRFGFANSQNGACWENSIEKLVLISEHSKIFQCFLEIFETRFFQNLQKFQRYFIVLIEYFCWQWRYYSYIYFQSNQG